MFTELSLASFTKLAKQHSRIVVHKEIPGDRLTPTNAYLALANSAEQISLLESNPKETHLGRYSHLCFDPLCEVKSKGQAIQITQANQVEQLQADPITILRNYQKQFSAKTSHPVAGYLGGMLGFISYDGIRLFENIPESNSDTDQVPDLLFRFYKNQVSFDHQTGKVIVATLVTISDDLRQDHANAMHKINQMITQLHTGASELNVDPFNTITQQQSQVNTDVSDEDFKIIVAKAKQHIVAGDVFQVVPSRKFSIETTAKPFAIYRALRFSNPSPYMFFLEFAGAAIAGASPEKLVSLKDGVIESCPLAGTRPRGEQYCDQQQAEDLLNCPKEIAEHMMLVDLSRNDLGKVAKPGTVKVSKLKQIEKYARVMHISSTVQAQLKTGADAFDVLAAAFTAGTLTGAPKIRAMQIIDDLENSRRGIYGGAVCAIDSVGNLDSCIAIRTAFIKDGVATVRAGAGVVFDSDPQAEADETRHKSKAILEAITLAQGAQL